MKIKTLSKSAIILLAVFSFACGGGETTSDNSNKIESPVVAKPVQEAPPVVSEPIIEEQKEEIVDTKSSLTLSGEEKIGNSDCLSCHLVERKVVGPSFKEIAAEYKPSEENITKLAKKVISGGTGVWGETAMPPHATLSEEDAKDMVKYILSLYE